jgi:hypothetical protein
VGDFQLAHDRGRFIDWPNAPAMSVIERIDCACDLVVERHYGSEGHPIDRTVIEARLHKFLDGD